MNPDSTLAVTKTCPKDGVHLSLGAHSDDRPLRAALDQHPVRDSACHLWTLGPFIERDRIPLCWSDGQPFVTHGPSYVASHQSLPGGPPHRVACAVLGSIISRPTLHAGVAQLVEQLIRNQQVNGSSPFAGSTRSPYNLTELAARLTSRELCSFPVRSAVCATDVRPFPASSFASACSNRAGVLAR